MKLKTDGATAAKADKARKAGLVYALTLSILFASAFYLDSPEPPPELYDPSVVPPVAVVPEPLPDFAAIRDVAVKKKTFFDFLQPYIDAKNAEVQHQRRRLITLIGKVESGRILAPAERSFLHALSREYDVQTDDVHDVPFLKLLLRRVDVLPPSLVLAQAANESAWGTSRFAQQGYNLFGQWCYTEGCGLVPSRRRASANHEVKSFGSVEEAVNAYFTNLNTFPSYQYMRLIRQDLRQKRKPIDGISLSEGLREYSERGEAYINELRSMIYYNDLLHRDRTITL